MSYAHYLQQQLRDSYVYENVEYYSTERVICAVAVVAAEMELRMNCQRCYVRYVLRAVSTAAAVVLPFYAATLWVIASLHTYSQSFCQQKEQQYPAFENRSCGAQISSHTPIPAPSLITAPSTCYL